MSCNTVSTFWFLIIHYVEKSFYIPSGFPLMIILYFCSLPLCGWICVASLRKRWPSANDIFFFCRNKAQRVMQANLARKKRALLEKKALAYIHLTVIIFFWQYSIILLLPAVSCLTSHINYLINQINTM